MGDDHELTPSGAPADDAEGAARLLPTTRLEAFSDGVFAIVVTLLVLELEVPEADERLLEELARGWPAYLGYVVSFGFIGGSWIAHTTMTRFLAAADGVLMRLNLVLLLFVSFLPFTTNLMATHLTDAEEGVAVLLFGLNLTLAAVLVNVVLGYAARTPGLADPTAERELRAFERERRGAVGVLAAATVAALVVPVVALVLYLAITLLLLVEPLWRARRRRLGARRR